MKLKDWREKKKLTQLAVSLAVGCHPNQISAWESGRGKPCRKYAIKITQATLGAVTTESWDENEAER